MPAVLMSKAEDELDRAWPQIPFRDPKLDRACAYIKVTNYPTPQSVPVESPSGICNEYDQPGRFHGRAGHSLWIGGCEAQGTSGLGMVGMERIGKVRMRREAVLAGLAAYGIWRESGRDTRDVGGEEMGAEARRGGGASRHAPRPDLRRTEGPLVPDRVAYLTSILLVGSTVSLYRRSSCFTLCARSSLRLANAIGSIT